MAGNRKNPSPHPVAPVLHVPLWASSEEKRRAAERSCCRAGEGGLTWLRRPPLCRRVPGEPPARSAWGGSPPARLAGCGSSPPLPSAPEQEAELPGGAGLCSPRPRPPRRRPHALCWPAGRGRGLRLGPDCAALRCAALGSALVGARQDRQADARLPPPPPGLRGRPEVRQRPTPLCKALGGAANSCLPSRGGGGGHKCELRPGNSIGPTKQARPDSTAYNEPRRPLS